jgi:hypothetical protein
LASSEEGQALDPTTEYYAARVSVTSMADTPMMCLYLSLMEYNICVCKVTLTDKNLMAFHQIYTLDLTKIYDYEVPDNGTHQAGDTVLGVLFNRKTLTNVTLDATADDHIKASADVVDAKEMKFGPCACLYKPLKLVYEKAKFSEPFPECIVYGSHPGHLVNIEDQWWTTTQRFRERIPVLYINNVNNIVFCSTDEYKYPWIECFGPH